MWLRKVTELRQEAAMVALIEQHREEVEALCRRYHVERLEVFGSAATAEGFDADSDVDFLVEFLPVEPRVHGRSYLRLLMAFQDLFGRDVDLVETRAIANPYFLDSVNRTRVLLYAA